MKLLLYIALVFGSPACRSTKAADSTNIRDGAKIVDSNKGCIEKYIETNRSNEEWPVSSIDEYQFQGKVVYALNPPKNYADASLRIISANCKDLCNVGGFLGRRNSNCNGDNFFEKAVLKKRIWTREK